MSCLTSYRTTLKDLRVSAISKFARIKNPVPSILSQILFKNRNWIFPVGRYFKWKLDFVSNILWMIVGYFEYVEFNDAVHIFHFRLQIPFFDKFVRKNQNCQFRLKSGTKTNPNMLNSVIIFTCFVFDRKKPF